MNKQAFDLNSASLIDMHCHLDFADNAKETAAASASQNITALCSTVMPSSFVAASNEFEPFTNIYVGLGIHPWWIGKDRVTEVDIHRFEELSKTTPFIGEIGLDFHGTHAASRSWQIDVFYRLLQACNAPEAETDFPNKLIFLHAVKAGDKMLQMLEREKMFDRHTCVFHWFSGTEDEFGRALSDGAWFSVGMRMMANDRGRKFAQAVPIERLLVETDNPPQEGTPWSADIWRNELQNTYKELARIRNVSAEELVEAVGVNSAKILQIKEAQK